MMGITILDTDSSGRFLAFDLKDILRAIGPCANLLRWRLIHIECVGERADEFHNLSDSGELVSGRRLIELSSQITQTIDGEVWGYRGEVKERDKPWLIIRAVDSSSFDVECDDLSLLERVKRHFKKVVDIQV